MRQEKIIRNLINFARNETASLKKVRWQMRFSKICGWVVLLVSFTAAFQEPDAIHPWIYTMTAAFGGALIGIGMWFESTLRTWSTLRQFVDLERLRHYGET